MMTRDTRFGLRRWSKFSLLTVLTMLIGLMLSACGDSTSTPAAPTTAAPTTAAKAATTAAPTTAASAATTTAASAVGVVTPSTKQLAPANITVWATGADTDAQVLQSAANAFSTLHPGVKVTVQAISWTDSHAKILAAVSSGTGPDMITGGLSFGIEFGQKGGLVDLKAKYPDLVDQIHKLSQPGIYDSLIGLDGKVYAVPGDLAVMMMYYRTDILEQNGLTPPKTWDELTAAVAKLQSAAKAKGLGFGWGATGWLGYFNFLYSAGGSFYDSKCTKATINNPAGLKSLQFYSDLFTKYKATTDQSADFEAGFANGDYPIGFNGSWELINMEVSHPELKGKWAAAPIVTGPAGKGTAFIGGRGLSIMNTSKNQDQAAEFIRYLYTDQASIQTSNEAAKLSTIWLPARVDMADKLQIPVDRINAIKAQLKDAAGPPVCPGWQESGDAVDKKLQEVILNKADPQKTLDEIANTMTQNLKQ